MKTIKYRAWTGTKMVIVNEIRWNDDGSIREINTEELSNIPGCDKWPLLEFTGLKDKNGVEIYEGDILRHISDNFLIHVEDFHGYRFMIGKDLLNKGWAVESEVIGNVFSNPELLKEGAE